MDFFQHQDDARSSSRTLVLYFVLAVIGIAIVVHDHEVTASEGELLRMVADALGLPMPPLLPGQRLGG